MKTLSDKLYQSLTAKERVDLALAAMAREDKAEFDRLNNTCVRKSYTMNDIEYTERLDELHRIKNLFLPLFTEYYHQCVAMDLIMESIQQEKLSLTAGYTLAGGDLNDDIIKLLVNKKDEEYQKFEYCFELWVSRLKGVDDALKQLCVNNDFNFNQAKQFLQIEKFFPKIYNYVQQYFARDDQTFDTICAIMH